MCEEGRADDGLALLIDRSTVDAMALAEYRRWSGGVWSVLERAAVLDGDGDALTVISGLRGSASLLRLGPGGPVREAFDPAILPTTSAKGIIFAHGEVSAALRRSEKLLSAAAPAHHVLPEVLAALQLARALALWPLHAQATLAFAETLLAMDLPAKAEAEAAAVWEQLRGAGVPRGALVRAKAAAAMALDALDARAARENATVSEDDAAAEVADPAPLFAQAARYADLALSRATDLGLRTLHRDARTLRTMLAEVAGIPFPRSAAADLPPPNGVERARRIGEIVRLVGVRVSEGWK
jgi:hypothetical protein